eukprot:jgi/Ulvmu1/5556/UM023_0092.1
MASALATAIPLLRSSTAVHARSVVCCGGPVPVTPAVRDRNGGVVSSNSSLRVPRLEPCVSKQAVHSRRPQPPKQHLKRRRDLTKALERENIDAAIDAILRLRQDVTTTAPRLPDAHVVEQAAIGSESGAHWRIPEQDGPGMAAIAYELRETNAQHADELASVFGGLHARLFRLCIRGRRPQVALNYAAMLPRSEKLHGSLMNEIAKHGTPSLVHSALDLRDKLGVPMDKFTLTSALSKLSSIASPDAVHLLYSTYCAPATTSATLTLDAYVFNAVLSSHANAGNTSQFDEVWHDMRSRGIAPTASSHACRLKLMLTTEGPYSALSHYRSLATQTNPAARHMSPHLFSTVFSAFAAAASATGPPHQQPRRPSTPTIVPLPAPRSQDGSADLGRTDATFQQLWSVWQDMRRFGIEPEDHLASAFLAAAKEMPLTPQQVEACFGVLCALRAARIKPGVGVLCNLLQLCARQDTAIRVLDIWALVDTERLRLNPHVLSAMLTCATAAAGESPEVPRLVARIEAVLRERWLEAAAGPRPDTRGWRVAFNGLLTYYAAARSLREGMAVFTFMKKCGPAPDLISFNAAISICGRTGQPRAAQALLREMRAAGLQPDAASFGAVLDACAKAQDVRSARRVLACMEPAGVAPNVIAYTSVMHACVREGSEESLAMVEELMGEMRGRGIVPTAVTYGCALSACEARKDAGAAFRLYHEACAAGVPPTDVVHDALIKACVAAGRLDEALDAIKRLMRSHGDMQAHTFNSVTRALCDQYIDRAMYMHRFMRLRKLQTNHKTYHALVAGCASDGMVTPALGLYSEMRALGHLPTGKAGSPLIAALARGGHLEAALHVLCDMVACSNGSTAPSSALGAAAAKLAGDDDSRRGRGAAAASAAPARWGAWGGRDVGGERVRALVESLPPLEFSQWERPGAAAARGAKRRHPRGQRPLRKGDMLPRVSAVAALALALCTAGEGDHAVRLYEELRRGGPATLAGLLARHTRMFEVLMEHACRSGEVEVALGVFDDWKAARDLVLRQEATTPAGDAGVASSDKAAAGAAASEASAAAVAEPPRLSNVTLAFLEASCHAPDDREGLAWRVYEVCALMRQQQEVARDAKLARPAKGSHHFLEDSEASDDEASGYTSASSSSDARIQSS